MTSNFHSGLLKDISLMLKTDDHNVIIQVGENQNKKEFHAHSSILRARSPYFKNIFSADNIKKENDMIRFNKPNITSTVFEKILKYIYTGEIYLKNQSGVEIFRLLVASDELFLEELFNYAQECLIKQQTYWIQQNCVLVLNTIFNSSNYKKLRDHCIVSICKDPLPVFHSNDFLDKKALFCLLKQDDLVIEEIIAWDYLIEWGIKQTSELKNKKKSEWTEKNYEDLKNNLSDFIPLIKFLKISSDDFYDKVRPYETIIPNNIYEEAMEYYLVEQPRLKKLQKIIKVVESNIINPILGNVIANWIDKRHVTCIRTEKDPSYNFSLIYRGSQDGIDSISFKNKCNGRVASFVLIKVQESEKIYGGYSSIGFNSIGEEFITDKYGWQWYNASDNFIFSFENKNCKDIQDMKISRVKISSSAILNKDSSGFNFGWDALAMVSQKLYVNNWYDNYENNLKSDIIYTIEEIEAYIVII